MTVTRLLPATAVRRACTASPVGLAWLVASSHRASVVHIRVVERAGERLSATGVVRRGLRSACGRRARRWRIAGHLERPLCAGCARWVDALPAGHQLPPSGAELAIALRFAARLADVEAIASAAAIAGVASQPAGNRPLHWHVGHARSRAALTEVVLSALTWPVTATGLTERGRAFLAFEHLTWRHPGYKDAVIRNLFGISPIHYAQQLNRLLDHPAALAADPALVHQLRRRRDGGRARRTGTRTADLIRS